MQNLKKEVFFFNTCFTIFYIMLLVEIFFVTLTRRIIGKHIIVKVFSRCPYKKMWKFSEQRDYDNTHYLFRYMRKAQFLCSFPRIYSGVGNCIVYFCSGLSTAFL